MDTQFRNSFMLKRTAMDIIIIIIVLKITYGYMTLFMQRLSNVNVVNTVSLVVADHSHNNTIPSMMAYSVANLAGMIIVLN